MELTASNLHLNSICTTYSRFFSLNMRGNLYRAVPQKHLLTFTRLTAPSPSPAQHRLLSSSPPTIKTWSLLAQMAHEKITALQPPTQEEYGSVIDIATEVIRLLKESDATVGVAESLTAGAVMSALASVPGSGSVFRGGVVSYATPLKQKLLGVSADLIAQEGVVHQEVAAQMAAGARKITTFDDTQSTTWGVATTGVAGPDKQDGKPAGTVYIGIAGPDGTSYGFLFQFKEGGDRGAIQEDTVVSALWLLKNSLEAQKDTLLGNGDISEKQHFSR
ncbi:competence-damaged protein-domain-containing protein [Podospora australis]|uniref:Competence-damaged protein-domain-containing protein n=1 Tax=Podospora australis TaxID=1536484 RepID=A0AAN6X1Q2_9PEZI|nr:competence-damaged protein-domain-containing protein [Podospora australis]